MYHEIAELAECNDQRLAVSPADFAAQLAYLRDEGFTAITAGAMSAILAGDSASPGAPGAPGALPDRTIVLTFDDGFADFRTRAMPMLEKYGFTATLFAISDFVEETASGRKWMSWRQLAEVAPAGIEVGAHSCHHLPLDQLPEKRLRDELFLSKERLEDRLGFAVPGMAYPFGYNNAKVRQTAREAGYEYAYAVGNLTATPVSDQFALPRLTVRQATTLSDFRRLVHGHYTMSLRRDRALTSSYSVVRRARTALSGASHG
jgi:peptidoglycan/xylan/chitin deacetylase (PgdA/CDA1 family)